jgi:peptidoglycan/xylan/chitin deacetylase (PgdA/CDA1 family)
MFRSHRRAGAGSADPRSAEHPDSFYLHERYAEPGRRSTLLAGYYAVKPLLPRRAQLAMRRAFARMQARRDFPAWPIEPVLVDRHRESLRQRIAQSPTGSVPVIGNWPGGHRFAFVLTHDVEGPLGVERLPQVLDIERRHGFVSSWNFVAEWYSIPEDAFAAVRSAGGEIGLHGIKHDGRLFLSRANFEADLPKIRAYLDDWDAVGFRSPATHRNADWMPELGCLYDSSFPDTDPFEPQSGGCCSILPFFLGDLVELPITLVQDHTLFEIVQTTSIDLWIRKTEWIIANRGLVNLIVHPDYLDRPGRLEAYDGFLAFLAARSDGWHALPRDVALWWRRRAALRCEQTEDGGTQIVGPHAESATLMLATLADREVRCEPAH